MIRTGRERKLRRKIRMLKGMVDAPKERKVKAVSRPVEDVFEFENQVGEIRKARKFDMKQAIQGGRPSLKDLFEAGYPTSR